MDEHVIIGGLKYQLNKNNYTATVNNSLHVTSHLIIPRSIVYESHEYIITTIQKYYFLNDKKITSIKFDEDSEVHTIEKASFSESSLISIFLPESIEKLKGFAYSNTRINYVSISPKNKNFKVISNSFIIGKSDQSSDIFDSLLFVSRNAKKVTVPPFIKYVCSNSMSSCKTLNQVIFTEDSQLLEIECDAFCFSSLQSINFPPNLKILHEGWCNYTPNLKYVKISLQNTNFCYLDSKQNIILGKTDLNQQFFDVIVFGSRSLKQVTIPNYIKRINKSAFSNCTFLEKVEISENSELESIGSNSFFRTSISEIYIPKHVKSIESFAFNTNEKLSIIDFAEDSELELIDGSAFVGSRLDKIVEIPIHVKQINKFAFNQCELLNSIIFKENAEIESFGECSFLYSNLTSIVIPKSLKVISAHAFDHCEQLKNVQFQKDSQLELIDKCAFTGTIIEELKIPKHVKKIGKKAFKLCNYLEKISFEEGSEINSICKRAFYGSAISLLEIPENLVDLQEGWCEGTDNLDMIKISPKNKKFIFFNGEMIISKSDINNQIYDTLVFVSRYVLNVNIPSFVKYIDPFAFHGTLNILNLDFPEDSQLLLIDKSAFSYSGIESLHIPEKVQELKDGWCNFTIYLNSVSISEKNNNFCFLPGQEKIILSKSNNKQEIFDVISFACRNINKVIIPNYIKYISSGAFCDCNYLVYVDFEEDSELQFIGENCFERTPIKNICTPEKLEKIEKRSFLSCINLYSFESLSKKFNFTQLLFNDAQNLSILSFPNVKRLHNIKIVLQHSSIYNQITFFVQSNAIID